MFVFLNQNEKGMHWSLCHIGELLAEHFGYYENHDGAEKAATAKEIDQGKTGRGKHGGYYCECDHKI